MAGKRFIMNAGRTSKQGQQINVGKDHDEYNAIVNTLIMHPEDMKDLGVAAGRQRPGAVGVRRRGRLSVPGGQGAAGHDLRPLRAADLPADGRRRPTAPACRPPRAGKSRSSRSRKPRASESKPEQESTEWRPNNRTTDGEPSDRPAVRR